MPYQDYAPTTTPPWLNGPFGRKWFEGLGKRMDATVSLLREGVQARLPGLAPSEALDVIGDDRMLPREPGESDDDYRVRLRVAWDIWGGDNRPLVGAGGGAGSLLGMLLAVKAVGLPTGPTGATVITHGGRWAQLDASDDLVLGVGMVSVNRQDLTGAVPGTLRGFYLDVRDQFYSKFALIFPADVPSLRPNTPAAARLNDAVTRWRQAKEHYMGAFVHEVGRGWDWPPNQTWDSGATWGGNTVHFIPPPF